MIRNKSKLENELKEFIAEEKTKIKNSVYEHIKSNDHSGLPQMIGRRYGFIWEKIVNIILCNDDCVNMKTKVFYEDFVKFWIEKNSNILEKECCKDSSKKLLLKFLDENTGTSNQDLCDFTFINKKENYAVDTKFKFNSNDSNTVREIANSGIHLNEMGFTPVLLMRRDFSESQQTPIKRFRKCGWKIISGKEATKFIYDITGFDIEEWIKNNLNIWNYLEEYHEQLINLRYGESSWDF